MPWATATPVLIWAVIFIPLTILLLAKNLDNRLGIILILIDYLLANYFFIQTVNWAVVNYYLRLLPILLCVILFIRFVRRLRRSPAWPRKTFSSLAITLAGLLILPVLIFMSIRVFQSTGHQGDRVLLLFPVRNGLYVIANGGNGLNGIGMNDDYQDWLGKKQSTEQNLIYAADVLKMSIRGSISQGILPDSHLDYVGFDDMVYSPCPGTIVYTEDGHPDLNRSSPGGPVSGNYIVLQCMDYYITLGSLRKGSITVRPGERVGMHVVIANMGSSAAPNIPHLHIHATTGDWKADGKPVPMLFEGSFAVNQFATRNKIFLPQD
ncbi:MAG: M23 family metallopeptidase [Omnitrophica WOR_2 bacterium]